MKQCIIYNPYANHAVTDTYVDFVEKCIRNCGIQTRKIESLSVAEMDTGAFVVCANDAPIAKKKGYHPIILWTQGILPEESYMRNKSWFRSVVLSAMELRGLKAADAYIFVSDPMRDHFCKKYRRNFSNYYIMPCFNSEIDKSSFFTENKYSENVFLYAGGLQVWQCFRETAELFSKIENRVKNCTFRVLTKDGEAAKAVLDDVGVKNYSIGYVNPRDISSELCKAKFGFSIRKDTPVNRVATPTKLSTYIAHGVMPIYSKALLGFGRVANDSEYCIEVVSNHEDSINKIVGMCLTSQSPQSVYDSFKSVFGNYYSTDFHRLNLTKFLQTVKETL